MFTQRNTEEFIEKLDAELMKDEIFSKLKP